MKIKSYESKSFLYTIIFVIGVFLCVLMFFSMKKNIRTYKVINSIVVKNNLVEAIVDEKDLRIIYKNKYLYINKKKILIQLVEINKKILKRNNKYYHSVLLNIKSESSVKENDTKKLLFFNDKITVFEMIKIIWKGA